MSGNDLDTTIKFSVDATGVEAGTTRVKRSLKDLGQAASETGKSTGSIGDGMSGASAKVEAATRNMIGSIQRQTAAMEAGDKSSRKYQESLARMRGIDTAALIPYLDQLDAMKAKHEASASSMAMMKSAGIAAGAALVGAAAGFAAFAKSAIDSADAMNDLSQRVGIAVKDLAKYELAANQSGTSMEAIAKGVKGLAGNLMEHGDALKKAGITAKDADGAMQQLADVFASMPDGMEKTTLATKMFGKAGMDLIPMLNLGSKGLADAAEKSAKYAEQMAAMAPMADAFNDSVAEIALHSKVAGMAMINDMLPALVEISKAMADAAQKGGVFAGVMAGLDKLGDSLFDWSGNTQRKNIANLTEDLADLREQQNAITLDIFGKKGQIQAEIEAKIKALADAKAAYFKFADGNAGRGSVNPASVKPINDGAADYRRLMDAIGGNSEAKKAIADANRELEAQAKLIAELNGLSGSFAEDWDRLSRIFAKGKMSLEELTKEQATLLAKQPFMVAAAKDQEKANKDLDKSLEKLVKDMEDYTEAGRKADAEKFKAKTAVADYVKGINDSAAALEFETSLMGQSAEARAMAIEQNAIYAESLQKIADIRKDPAWGTDTAARDTAIVDVQVAAATKAATASGRAALAEWNRTNDRISDGLVSALTKGGHEGAQQVRDLLVKELVMEPFQIVVRALLQPVTQGLANAAVSSVGGSAAGNSGGSLLGNAVGSLAGAQAGAALSTGSGLIGQFASGFSGSASTAASLMGAEMTTAASLGSMVAAALPWVAGAMLVASTLQGGETRSGAQYSNKGVLGDVNYTEGPSGGEIASDAARAAFIGAQDSINLILKRVGSSATLAGFNAGLESSKNGHGFAGAGGTLSTGATFGDTGDLHSVNAGSKTTEVAMAEYVSELRVSVMQALQAATDIPKGISDKLAGIDLNNISQKAFDELEFNILSVIQLQEGLKELPFENLKTLSFEAADGLLAAADALDNVAKNGAESLGILLNSYYTNFYTETEKTALLTTNTAKAFTDLGLVMPTVDEGLKAAYRSEIERLGALDLSVEANAKAYAGALALQGSVSTLATTFDAAADKMAKAMASLQSEVDKYNLNAGTATDITIAQSATDRAWAKVIEKLPGVSGISQVDAAHWLATASAEMLTTVAGAAMPEVTAFLAAFNSLTSATTAAAQTTIDAAQALQDSFSAAGKGIYDFVQDLIRSTATTDQLWATYKTDLVLAQAGDVKASERITTSAQAYLEKQRAGASTTAEAALATARMVSELSVLPAAQSYEQDMLAKLEEIAKNTYGLDELAHIRDAISDRNWDPAHKAASVASMAALANTNGWTVAEMAAASGYSMADIAALFAGYSVPGNMGGTATPTTPTTTTPTTPSIGGGNAIDTGAELVAFAESMDWVSTTMAQRVTQAMQVRATGLEGNVTIADMMSASSKPWDAWFATLGVPAFDKGTNYLPEDMLAQVHKGERIIPAADNTLLMQRLQSPQANNDVLVAEIRALRAEVSELRKSNSAENVAIAGNTKNAARRLETFEADGIAVRNDATKPFTVEISA